MKQKWIRVLTLLICMALPVGCAYLGHTGQERSRTQEAAGLGSEESEYAVGGSALSEGNRSGEQAEAISEQEEQALLEMASHRVTDGTEAERLGAGLYGMTEEELGTWRTLGMSDENVLSLGREQTKLYYYNALSEEQRFLYAQILMVLKKHGEGIVLSERDESTLDLVFQAVLNDHPEIFYVSGYTYTRHSLGSTVLRLSFSGTYTMDIAQVNDAQIKIDNYVNQCLQNMPAGDDYEKLRYLYEYIIIHTDYQLDAPENQNICSVFLYGQSVCLGYARALQYLCGVCGIEATLVNGSIRNNNFGHAWNLVRLDGAYYYVDVTWGDASYQIEEGDEAQVFPGVNYDYLCVTTQMLEITHEINSILPMPYCVETKDNYYVRENACFDTFDVEALSALFDAGADEEGHYVVFRCTSDAIYQAYYDYLITGQAVFAFMNAPYGASVSYAGNREMGTIGFWIAN